MARVFWFRYNRGDVGSAWQPSARGNMLHEAGDHALSRCLDLDLEVGRNDGRIHALAGVRPDTATSFTFARSRGLPQALSRLDELAQGADFLLGYNL